MTDQFHLDALAASPPLAPSPSSRACMNCVHFARLVHAINGLHGICAEFIVARGGAPVMAETDGKHCSRFQDASEARAARAIQDVLEEAEP